MQLFHRNSCKIFVYYFKETRRGGLVRPASKSGRFSHHPLRVPKAWHRDFAACGQRSGLLALNLANIFEKLLDQKTFSCLRQYSWKTTRIRFGKAGAHPQLAFEIAIAPETLFHVTTFRLWRQLRFFRFPLRFLLLLIIHSLQGAACPLHPSPS